MNSTLIESQRRRLGAKEPLSRRIVAFSDDFDLSLERQEFVANGQRIQWLLSFVYDHVLSTYMHGF